MENNVAEYVDGLSEVLAQDGTVENSVFLVSEGIQLAPQTLDGIDNLDGRTTGRSLERQVFAEMGQSFLSHHFVSGAGFDTDATVDDLRWRRQVNDPHSAVQNTSIVVHRAQNYKIKRVLQKKSFFFLHFCPLIRNFAPKKKKQELCDAS